MPLPLNTGFIIAELEKVAATGHPVGDVEAPTWLLAAAASRMTKLAADRRTAQARIAELERWLGKARELTDKLIIECGWEPPQYDKSEPPHD